MNFIFEYLTLGVFLLVYWLVSFNYAIVAVMISYTIKVIYLLAKKNCDQLTFWTWLIIMICSGASLFFHDPRIFMWKPTIVYWLMASAMIIQKHRGKPPFIQKILTKEMAFTDDLCRQLENQWMAMFFILGSLNLVVAYHVDLQTWVLYKVFGTLAIVLVFAIGQGLWSTYYLKHSTSAQLESKHEHKHP